MTDEEQAEIAAALQDLFAYVFSFRYWLGGLESLAMTAPADELPLVTTESWWGFDPWEGEWECTAPDDETALKWFTAANGHLQPGEFNFWRRDHVPAVKKRRRRKAKK